MTVGAGLMWVANLVVFACAARWARWWWPGRDRFDRILHASLLGYLFIVTGMEALSLVGMITAGGVVLLTVLAAGLAWFAPREPTTNQAPKEPPLSRWSKFAIGLTLTVSAWSTGHRLVQGRFFPVEPVSDAPIYHLHFASQWAQLGTLMPIATPFGELSATYFPANGDVWLTWLTVAEGTVRWAKVGQWPAGLLAMLALGSVARRLGARPAGAIAIACLWGTTVGPTIASQVADVDLIAGACLFLAINEVLRPAPAAALIGLAVGAAAGTKSVYLVFGSIVVLGASLRMGRRRAGVIATWAVLPAGFWFLRTALLTSNPLFPLQVQVLGRVLFTGCFDRATMSQSTYHLDWTQWPMLLTVLTGYFDLRVLAVTAVGGVIGLTQVIQSWRRPWQSSTSVVTLLSLVLLAATASVIPYNTQGRFYLPAIALLTLPLARTVGDRAWLCVLMALFNLWRLVTPAWSLDAQMHLTPVGAVLPLAPVLQVRDVTNWLLPLAAIGAGIVLTMGRQTIAITIAVVLVLIGVIVVGRPIELMLRTQPGGAFYPFQTEFANRIRPAWLLLDQVAQPGARVAYAGTNLPYYLVGEQLARRVRYINVAGGSDWLLHDFHAHRRQQGQHELSPTPFPDWHRADADFDVWYKHLQSARIDWLFIARQNRHGQPAGADDGPPAFPIELLWARQHADRFEIVGPPTDPAGPEPWAYVIRVRPTATQ